MTKKSFLESIQSPLPCSKNWDEMSGDEKARFCQSCAKDVYNISEMTRQEARIFVARNSGKACVRFERLPDGKVLTTDAKLHKIAGRTSRIAAGVLGATLTLSVIAGAQIVEKPQSTTNKATQSQTKSETKTSQISFTIIDSNNAVVPGTEVKLTNKKTNQEFKSFSGDDGIVQFSLIPHGLYEVEVNSLHFRSHKQTVQINQTIEPNTKITLEVGTFTGIVSIDSYEIPFFTIIAQDNQGEIKRMISQGFDVKTKDSNKRTALHIAVEHSNPEAVKILLDANASVNVKDKYNHTPLLMIEDNIEENTPEIIRLLIQKGADVNVQDKQKRTALMVACDEDNFEIAKMLLEAGANPNSKDEDGETALEKAGEEEIIQLLKQYGACE